MRGDGELTGREVESEARQTGWPRLRGRLFHMLFLMSRPMTLGARGLVFDRARNAVLLIRHTYVPGWQIPGGGVEPGETVLQALERELREEGNIELLGPPKLLSIHFNRHVSRRDHVAFFLITEFRQTKAFAPNREIAEAVFFSVDALPSGATGGTLRRIREVVLGEPASPWW